MTSTHEAFQQISDLLVSETAKTVAAWNLFTQVLREAHDAGYDAGVQDAVIEYNTNPHFPED